MSETLNLAYNAVDGQHREDSAATRRQLVAGAAATIGGLGLLGVPDASAATDARSARHSSDPQTILNVAATAEVVATIINTTGFERGLGGDEVTRRNIEAAAREELIHYQVLVSSAVGGRPLAKRIWIPDAVFASRTSFLNAVTVGDTVFVNAYLIATTVFGNRGNGNLARITSEFMAVELVHRALARQSLGLLGNDKVFAKYSQAEDAVGAPNRGKPGFRRIESAVAALEANGIGFGKQGSVSPGQFYDFDAVSQRTPNPPDLSTRTPR